jgi:hypothetical protein
MKISNTKNITKLLVILFISALTFTACDNDNDHDDDNHDHEEELITTVNYILTPDGGGTLVTLNYTDLDGEGGADGTYTISGPLLANTTYFGAIELLNETENPAEDITEEIEEDADEHEFFYTTDITGLSITKTDKDANDNFVGLETDVVTGASGSGVITIVLKHEPTKPNDGTADGAGGSTDVEVTFDVSVQ